VRERDRARFVFARERVRAIVYEHQVLVMKRKLKSEKNERVRTFSRVETGSGREDRSVSQSLRAYVVFNDCFVHCDDWDGTSCVDARSVAGD